MKKDSKEKFKEYLLGLLEENKHFDRFIINSLYINMAEYKKSSPRKRSILIFKKRLALLYLLFNKYYCNFISKITAYYPFSLLWQDRLYHHKVLSVNKLMKKFENISKKAKLNIKVFRGRHLGETCEFDVFFNEKGDKEKSIEKLEKILQNEFGTVYVRPGDNNETKIIMPTELFNQLTEG